LEIIGRSSIIETLNKVLLFKNFTMKKLEVLAEKMETEKIDNGKKIIIQGEEGSKFYIVKSGKVDIYANGHYIRTINENEYFGERALFFKEPRSATAIANGPVELYNLDKEYFKSNIEENMKDYLINRLYLQDNTIELKDIDYVQQLGTGNYGAVSLVQSRKNKFLYAIKAISKTQIDYEQLHKNLELERSILLKIDHPFIVKLVKTLKDNKFIYFLMEYVKGKELFDVIRDIGLLNKYQTQFYGASLMLAVEYLHDRKFIYRDIKPENIMVIENVNFIFNY
jgi:cGMP-dependent protein kinase